MNHHKLQFGKHITQNDQLQTHNKLGESTQLTSYWIWATDTVIK